MYLVIGRKSKDSKHQLVSIADTEGDAEFIYNNEEPDWPELFIEKIEASKMAGVLEFMRNLNANPAEWIE